MHNIVFNEVENVESLKGKLKPMEEFSASQNNNNMEIVSVKRGNKRNTEEVEGNNNFNIPSVTWAKKRINYTEISQQ